MTIRSIVVYEWKLMNWIDLKYVNMLSIRLERFKRVQDRFNMRCPICGDSKKSKSKTRGWILPHGNKTWYYCHNCNISLSLSDFIKSVDQTLYFEYIKDIMLEKSGEASLTPAQELANQMKKPVFVKNTGLSALKKISALDPSHPAKQYVMDRMIPSEVHYKLFYAPKFKKWVNNILPGKFETLEYDEPRLIIPFLDEKKNFFGFQGRSFRPKSDLKYITILLDESKPKVFGLDTVDPTSTIYAFEGPVDSLFIPNAIASAGGRIDSILELTNLPKHNIVVVYDNEPRSKETVQKMEAAIADGYAVCFWPELDYKDVNDMVKDGGFSQEYIKYMIDSNTYTGLKAQLQLAIWKKV